MLKVWGRKDSSNVQKVVWCCDELGVPFERINIAGAFGKNREKPYIDLNPNGLVPTIEDEGFVLWESNSIVRYLIEKHGKGRLLPTTMEARASANRWMDWQLTAMNPFMVTVYLGLIRMSEGERDLGAIESGRWLITLSRKALTWLGIPSAWGISRWVSGPIAGSTCPSIALNCPESSSGTNVSVNAQPIRKIS